MSLLAKNESVSLDAVTTCASFIMMFPDFSYLMCLLNTTSLVIESWGDGDQCSTIRLDDSSLLMLVNMTHSCTEGYTYATDEHKCMLIGKYFIYGKSLKLCSLISLFPTKLLVISAGSQNIKQGKP